MNPMNLNNAILFDDYILHKNVVHTDNASLPCEPTADITTYNSVVELTPQRTELKTSYIHGDYYGYVLPYDCDVVDQIVVKSNKAIEVLYSIGGWMCRPERVKEYILCAGENTRFQIIVKFLDRVIGNDIEITIHTRNWVIHDKRDLVKKYNTVMTSSAVYFNGECTAIISSA